MKPFRGLVILTMVLSLSLPLAAGATIERNCDNNAVVYCGAETQTELIQKIYSGDGKNSADNISQILSSNGVQLLQIGMSVDGIVTRNGDVIVGGQTVATSAETAGRQNIPGSVADGSVWKRPTQISFASGSLPAFVMMQNKQFVWAVIKSCGNPVMAKAVVAQTSGAATITPQPPTQSTPPASTPQTGATNVLVDAIGVFVLWSTYKAYSRSRSQLRDALLGVDS